MTDASMDEVASERRSLDSLFSQSARRFPNRPALFVAGRAWTYRELDAESAAIEQTLHAAGLAGSERRVGLIYARSGFSYAAIIAILRSNCVYVPLNPKAPAARLLKIIEDAGIEAIVVDRADPLPEGVVGALQGCQGVRIISNGTVSGDALHPRSDVVHPGVAPRLAYIIYTSGSTGEPKGVAISHDSACHCMERVHDLFEATEQDRFTQFCALSFDYSLVELFVCWRAGAALYVPAASEALVPLSFAIAHRITVWFSVPSLAAFLMKLGLLKPNVLPSVRLSLFGGEALPFELAHAWAVATPGARMLNLYGPTEVTIVSTSYELNLQTAPRAGTVPIGQTLTGLSYRIVDEGRCVDADDAPGELWLGGDQLAQGYWKNPTATAAAFVHAQLDGTSTTRWYRTGDLVSNQPGVGISFRGRIDRQVKLRGLRIELQEIESVLREVIGCALVAVVPVRNAGGIYERIVAYCDRLTADESTIKTRCLQRVPPYMVPERITQLEEFPLNDSGKINYLALAALTTNVGEGSGRSALASKASR